MKTNLKTKKAWKKPTLAVHSRMLTEGGLLSGVENNCANCKQ